MRRRVAVATCLLTALALAACSDDPKKFPPGPDTFSISGEVSGDVREGVSVSLSGDASGSIVTDGDGRFSFENLSNGAYTLTASRHGYSFSPSSLNVTVGNANLTGQSFVATALPTYTVSGAITGESPAGVTLTLTPGGATALSAADGAFTLAGVLDGSYTLTASKPGFVFTPASLSLTVAGANVTGMGFTSTAAEYTLSGTIAGASSPVTVRLSGDVTAVTQTDDSGHYSFTQLGHAQAVTVTPSLAGHTFNPPSHSVTLEEDRSLDFAGSVTGAIAASMTGTLSYAGTRSGRVYVTVTCADGTSFDRGTSFESPGAFTVHGVQCASFPTTAVAKAWIDTLDIGRFNRAADPHVTKSVILSSATSTIDFGEMIIQDPAAIDPVAPHIETVIAGDNFAGVVFQHGENASGEETGKRYRIYWSTTVTTPGPAVGDHDGMLEAPPGPNFVIAPVASGNTYYFSISAVLGDDTETTPRPWFGGGVAVGPKTGTQTISGQVSFGELPAGTHALYILVQAANPTAPEDPSQVILRAHRIIAPTSPASYSLEVPDAIYAVRAVMDFNNDGLVTFGEPNQLMDPNPAIGFAMETSPTGVDIDLPWTNVLGKSTIRQSGTSFLDFHLQSNLKTPVRASIVAGPSVPLPIDLGIKNGPFLDQHPGRYFALEYAMDPVVPTPGDTYTLRVWYADGSSEDVSLTAE